MSSPTYVQSAPINSTGGVSSSTFTYPANNTAGNFLYFCVMTSGSLGITGVVSSAGNNYVLVGSTSTFIGFGNYWAQVYCAYNCAGGVADSVTISYGNTGGSVLIFSAEYSNVPTSGVVGTNIIFDYAQNLGSVTSWASDAFANGFTGTLIGAVNCTNGGIILGGSENTRQNYNSFAAGLIDAQYPAVTTLSGTSNSGAFGILSILLEGIPPLLGRRCAMISVS